MLLFSGLVLFIPIVEFEKYFWYTLYAMEEEASATQNNQGNNECEELKNKCEEYLSGWKRAKADFINYQKDEQRRLHEFARFANEALLQNLIIVLDSFNLAVNAAENPDKGLLIIKNQLEDILKKHGLEPIPIKTGDVFSPELHEAVAATDAPMNGDAATANTIAEIMEAGYTLNGKVVRPSKVKIYS